MRNNRQRARRRTRQELAPQRRDARQNIRQINRGAAKEIASYAGATDAAISGIEGMSLKGIRGPIRQQIQRNNASQIASLQTAQPLMAASIRSDAQDQVQSVRQSVPSRAEVMQENLSEIRHNQHARKVAASADAKDQAASQQDARKDMLKEISEAGKIAKSAIAANHVPQSEAEWQQFTEWLGRQEGIGTVAARRAVRQIRSRVQPMTDTGKAIGQVGDALVRKPVTDSVSGFFGG